MTSIGFRYKSHHIVAVFVIAVNPLVYALIGNYFDRGIDKYRKVAGIQFSLSGLLTWVGFGVGRTGYWEREGLFVGMSSGAAVSAAWRLAGDMDSGTLVVILPDRGDRFLSTTLFRSVCAKCPP